MNFAKVYHSRGAGGKREYQCEAGRSIQEIVLELNPDTGEWEAPTVCFKDGAPLGRDQWAAARVAAGEVVVFRSLPMGGGGSNPLKILLGIAIMVAAVWTGGLAAGLVTGFAGAAAGQVVGGLVTAAIMSLAGGILKTPALPSGHSGAGDSASPTYSVGAANNPARLGQVIGESFGRMKIVPDRVANAYSLYINNEHYLHQVFGLGRGLVDVESMSFGDSVFWTGEGGVDSAYDVDVQFREPGEAVTLFPDNVETSGEVSGQQLHAPNQPEYPGWTGPFSANPPGTLADRIIINLSLPQGLYYVNNKGGRSNLSISYTFEYQRLDDYGAPLSGWAVLASETLTMATPTAQRRTLDVPVTSGRYQVRARRTNDVTLNGRAVHGLMWESLQAFLPGTLCYNQSVVAIRTRATNTLSQQAANAVSVIQTRKLPVWNPDTRRWSEPVATRSFAAAVAWMLRCDWGGRLADSKIDLEGLWRLDQEKIAARGWTFDGYYDGSYSVWQLVNEAAKPFRVVPRINSGLVTFIFDEPGRPARHRFTTADIVRGTFGVTYHTYSANTPDDVIITYLDEAAGFQTRDVRVTLPNSEGRTPATLEYIGLVNRDQAFQAGLFLAACNRHRRLAPEFQTEGAGRLISAGDVCTVTHPFLTPAQCGTVVDWQEGALALDLGTAPLVPDGGALYLSLDGPGGEPWGPCRLGLADGAVVTLDPADYASLLVQGRGNPFEWLADDRAGAGTAWVLHTAREYEGRAIVTAVVPVDRFHYRLELVNDATEVESYAGLPTPPWQYRNNGINASALTAPENLSGRISGTQEAPVITLTWLPVRGADSYEAQASGDDGAWADQGRASINSLTLEVTPGAISVRIRARDEAGRVGPWSRWIGDTNALFERPPALEAPEGYQGARLRVVWNAPETSAPVSGFTLSVYPEGSATAVRSDPLPADARSYTYTAAMGAADGGPWRELTLVLETILATGPLGATSLTAADAVPGEPEEARVTVGPGAATIEALTVFGDSNGFVIVRGDGPDFDEEGVLERRVVSHPPYTWSGLPAGTPCHFRLAGKDAFFDAALDYRALNYSPVYTVIPE